MRRARQVAYSLSELEQMSGLSKRRLAHVLERNGVQLHQTGEQKKRLVFVSEFEAALPALVDSVRFRGAGGADEE